MAPVADLDGTRDLVINITALDSAAVTVTIEAAVGLTAIEVGAGIVVSA